MPAVLAKAALALLKDLLSKGSDSNMFKVLFAIVAGVFAMVLLPLMVPAAILWGTTVPAGEAASQPPGIVGFWPDLVRSQNTHGIPDVLVLGVIDHESGGHWRAEKDNADGTADAGLMQVNSRHWKAYGMEGNPYAPAANVAAGLNILAAAVRGCPNDVSCALEAYNGGGTGYAQAVLGAMSGIESRAHLAVWPLGDMGDGSAVAIPAQGQVTFLVTAYAPWGYPPRVWDGRSWPGIEGPQGITATASPGGAAVTLQPCSGAPAAIRQWLPPQAGCLYAVLTPPPGQPARIEVTAWFLRSVIVTDPKGHQTVKQETVAVIAQASATPSATAVLDLP